MQFTTLEDPKQFPGQKSAGFGFSSLDWPYVEGLRIDEAMHPLTLMVVGMYYHVYDYLLRLTPTPWPVD